MNLTVDRLTRQIPQHGFAVGAILAFKPQLWNRPELLTMCGGVLP